MATEMAEVYWLSLTRDVPFREYETDVAVAAAVADMNAFTEPLTPTYRSPENSENGKQPPKIFAENSRSVFLNRPPRHA
jgi:hypothetical protein